MEPQLDLVWILAGMYWCSLRLVCPCFWEETDWFHHLEWWPSSQHANIELFHCTAGVVGGTKHLEVSVLLPIAKIA